MGSKKYLKYKNDHESLKGFQILLLQNSRMTKCLNFNEVENGIYSF